MKYDSVTVHFSGARAPRDVNCVTDVSESKDLRTGNDSLQILHKSCEGEQGNLGALVVKPLEVPVPEIDYIVLRRGGDETTVEPEQFLG